jgi:hypothetical protein
MRKLLALFGAVGLVSMSAATVVSCNDVADLGYYADSIENNLRTENYVVDEDDAIQNIKMSDYFDESGWFFINTTSNKPNLAMTIADFNGAIEMAIDTVVDGSAKGTDYKYSIKSAHVDNKDVDKTTLKYTTEVKSNEALAAKKVAFDIHIEANKDSTLWKGTTDIYMLANWGGEQ